MGYTEKESIINHISAYQKTHGEWDIYRKKIPDELLVKWGKILFECRKNGFINPHIYQDTLVWDQVMGSRRNYDNADKCSLCSNSLTRGTCEGKTIYKKMQSMFVPCWVGGN